MSSSLSPSSLTCMPAIIYMITRAFITHRHDDYDRPGYPVCLPAPFRRTNLF